MRLAVAVHAVRAVVGALLPLDGKVSAIVIFTDSVQMAFMSMMIKLPWR